MNDKYVTLSSLREQLLSKDQQYYTFLPVLILVLPINDS